MKGLQTSQAPQAKDSIGATDTRFAWKTNADESEKRESGSIQCIVLDVEGRSTCCSGGLSPMSDML